MIEVDRRELNNVLQTLRHAIATVDAFPVLCCVHFSGTWALAFDGSVALRVQWSGVGNLPPFSVQHGALAVWTKSARGDRVAIEVDTTSSRASFSCGGSSRVTVSTEPDWSIAAWPETEGCELPAEFGDALLDVVDARGVDANEPWRLGVTALFTEGAATLYATNNLVLAYARVPISDSCGSKVLLLRTRILDVVRALKVRPDTLRVSDRWVGFTNERCEVLGLRDAPEPDVGRFEAVIGSCSGWELAFASLPEGFWSAVDRLCRMHPGGEAVRARIWGSAGVLHLDCNSRTVAVNDTFSFDGDFALDVEVDARLLHRHAAAATSFRVDGAVFLLKSPAASWMVGTLG